MSWMFEDCKSLKSLDVSRFDVGNVENMGYMFYGCESLEELDVGKFKTDVRYVFFLRKPYTIGYFELLLYSKRQYERYVQKLLCQ